MLETARMFAMVQTAVSDAVIVGFEAKYRYAFWRPRTAIPQADADGNHDTDADPSWRPLLSVNHPEYPSGHGFWSTALLDSRGRFLRHDAGDVDDHDVEGRGAARRTDRRAPTRISRRSSTRSATRASGAACTGGSQPTTAARSAAASPAHVSKHFFEPRK